MLKKIRRQWVLLAILAGLAVFTCGRTSVDPLQIPLFEDMVFDQNKLDSCNSEDRKELKRHMNCLKEREAKVCESAESCDPLTPVVCDLSENLNPTCRKNYLHALEQGSMPRNFSCADAVVAAKYAKLVYPYRNDPDSGSEYRPAGTKVLKDFRGDPTVDGYALVALSGQPQKCHVSVKGTTFHDFEDLKADLRSTSFTDCKAISGQNLGQCAEGFYLQYKSLRDDAGLLDFVDKLLRDGQCPGGVGIYGHSMGGSIASLLAAELHLLDPERYKKSNVWIVSFGEPRIFSAEAAAKLHAELPKLRIINRGDFIPTLPPAALGFLHFGTPVHISRIWTGDNLGGLLFESVGQDYSPENLGPLSAQFHQMVLYIQRLETCAIR